MDPAAFVEKWKASPKREHADAQPHFLDLWRLTGIDTTADPVPELPTFEIRDTTRCGMRAAVWHCLTRDDPIARPN